MHCRVLTLIAAVLIACGVAAPAVAGPDPIESPGPAAKTSAHPAKSAAKTAAKPSRTAAKPTGKMVKAAARPAKATTAKASAKPAAKPIKVATRKAAGKVKPAQEKKLVPVRYNGTFIKGKLDAGMQRASVPPEFASEVRRALAYLPDFPQMTKTSAGTFRLIGARDGTRARLVAASIRTAGREYRLFRYGAGGHQEWVDGEGNLLSAAAFVKPVDGGRMSSGYGWRVHPVLGDWRFHNGVDFALPKGSPVYAAQNGVVIEVGRRGNYGNLIRLDHGHNVETVYAHLEGFAPGLRVGAHVRRGQTIAYVGASGLATGPHLYWETIRGDSYVDPLRVLEESKVPPHKLEELRRSVAALESSRVGLSARGRSS